MTLQDELRDAWTRDSGEVVAAKMYGDDTVTIAIYPDDAMSEADEAFNLSRSVLIEALNRATDGESGFELDEPSMSSESIVVETNDEWMEFSSTMMSEQIRLTQEEVENVLDHARDARKSMEYEGLI